ncbi:hypothetical protein ACFQZ4_19800 [Catellatospora coxensis]
MTALAVPAGSVRIHRAPPLDPPFDDELRPTTYRPARPEPHEVIPPAAVAGASPECHTAALRFLNLCLELFNGFRSPASCARCCASPRPTPCSTSCPAACAGWPRSGRPCPRAPRAAPSAAAS